MFSVFGGSGELASFVISNFVVAGMVPNRISVSWIKTGGLGWGLERFGDVLERSWIGPERSWGVSGTKNLLKTNELLLKILIGDMILNRTSGASSLEAC